MQNFVSRLLRPSLEEAPVTASPIGEDRHARWSLDVKSCKNASS